MPYALNEQGSTLRLTVTGAPTGQELHKMVDELETLMAGRTRWPDNLLDLRSVQLSGLGIGDLLSFSKRRDALVPPHPVRLAIVADSPTITGYARMLQSLSHNRAVTIEVFGDVAEAERWFAAPR